MFTCILRNSISALCASSITSLVCRTQPSIETLACIRQRNNAARIAIARNGGKKLIASCHLKERLDIFVEARPCELQRERLLSSMIDWFQQAARELKLSI